MLLFDAFFQHILPTAQSAVKRLRVMRVMSGVWVSDYAIFRLGQALMTTMMHNWGGWFIYAWLLCRPLGFEQIELQHLVMNN